MTDERNSLLPKSFWCISLLLLAAKMPHIFYHCMYYLTLQIKATFVYRIYVAFYQCGVWASSEKNQYCKGEVPCEFCGHAYMSVTVTSNKRQWWVANIHIKLSILIFSDQACCKRKGVEGNVKYTTSKLSVPFCPVCRMFLLTTSLTPGSAAGAAQYPAALLWKEMLSIWIDIPAEN